MKFYPKNVSEEITYGLNTTEYRCHCIDPSCRCIMIDPELVDVYLKFRIAIGKPLTINSGFRCQQHNRIIGGKQMSRHQSGEAIDISNENLPDPAEVTKIARQSGFRFIKYYPDLYFWHLDIGER